MGLDDLIPVVPEYLQEESSQEENLDQENDVEEQEIEQDSVDYSLYLEDILSNQETIISNQEALLLDNQNFEHHYKLYDNAFKAMTNITNSPQNLVQFLVPQHHFLDQDFLPGKILLVNTPELPG